jgi:hypothetical protein
MCFQEGFKEEDVQGFDALDHCLQKKKTKKSPT